jgi:molecular chaperone DnaK
MKSEAEEFREEDRVKKEFADLLVNADGLVYATEKSLEEFADMLSAQDVEEIRDCLRTTKDLVEGATREDYPKLKEAVMRLETAAHRIADAMYQGASDSDDDLSGE